MIRCVALASLSTARTLRVTATVKAVAPVVQVAAKALADAAAVLAAAQINLRSLNQKDRFITCPFLFLYLPRKNEINVPNPPIKPSAMMNKPTGTRFAELLSGKNVGTTNSGGGV